MSTQKKKFVKLFLISNFKLGSIYQMTNIFSVPISFFLAGKKNSFCPVNVHKKKQITIKLKNNLEHKNWLLMSHFYCWLFFYPSRRWFFVLDVICVCVSAWLFCLWDSIVKNMEQNCSWKIIFCGVFLWFFSCPCSKLGRKGCWKIEWENFWESFVNFR